MKDLDAIYFAVRELAPEDRPAYLTQACAGDHELRARVNQMLAVSAEAEAFITDLPDDESEDRTSDNGSAKNPRLDPADAPDEAVGQTLGRYKLLERVGEGGCGVVYVAEQTEPVRRRVALKVIKLGMDTREVISRFEAERQALAMMDHPNIAKVLDAGTTDPHPQPLSLHPMKGEGGQRPGEGGGEGRSQLSTLNPQLPQGRPYFVMELVRGIKITDYCDQANLPTRERLDLFIKVCQAIQHAHQKGIIHRDIKPSNILVTLHDGVPVPKVIDFGIAKATEGRLTEATVYTQLHQFIGTPAYMSPEQAEMSGLDIDTRSDIYSLGVLLYELLAGSTPFDAKELMASGLDAMRKTIREKEPVRPSTKLTMELTRLGSARGTRAGFGAAPDSRSSISSTGKGSQSNEGFGGTPQPARGTRALPAHLRTLVHQLQGDLDWIVMKCLEKDRARRYESANGLAADLKRHLSNEPVVARPPSAAYRFQKAWRRNKLAFAAAGAVAGALLLGVVVSAWQAVRATQASKAESRQRLVAEGAQAQAQTKQREAEAERSRAETERQRANAQATNAIVSQEHSQRLLYAADMNLAQQSLKLNNLGRARRLLEQHRPKPGEEDLRGWEWRYLWQLTRSSALVTLTNRPMFGCTVSFSPDGTRLAVGWSDGHVELWDVPGRRLLRALNERKQPPPHVAFSPHRNLLAATSEPKVVRLYDLDSGRDTILWRAPDQGFWQVRDLSFSQDGSKLVIYAASSPELGDAAWVVNVSSSQIESRHPTAFSDIWVHGAARLSPDNRRLYLARSGTPNSRCSIQCLDLTTGQELWQTETQRDYGLTTLAVSPDGRVLASGSGFEDPTIRVWDTATGRLLVRLDGHTGFVAELAFTKDGRRLISAATDQTIRFWDTGTWTETKVLRGHTDEVHAVALSETAQLVASASKNGDLMLWREDGKSASDGYSRLPVPEKLALSPMDASRVLLLPPGQPPEWVDLKRDFAPVPLPEIGFSADVFDWFGTNLLCHWNGTNQIVLRELRGAEFIPRGAILLASGIRPAGLAYNATRQLLAWSERALSNSVYLANLAAPDRRIELKGDVPGLAPALFSEDGNYLAAGNGRGPLRVWNVEAGQIVASSDGFFREAAFAAGGRVLVVAMRKGNDHEIVFYDLAHADRAPRRVPGRDIPGSLAVSPDGGLVASATYGGLVRLFDPAKGELIETLHGHLNGAFSVAFSKDGHRLISTSGGREAVKLWDVGTRQELLTLGGTGSFLLAALWSADGDMILAGEPWQAWRAPSWEEINAAEAKEKSESKQP